MPPPIRSHKRGQSLGTFPFRKDRSVSKFNIEDLLGSDQKPSLSPLKSTSENEEMDTAVHPMAKLNIEDIQSDEKPSMPPSTATNQKPPLSQPKGRDAGAVSTTPNFFAPKPTVASKNHPLMKNAFNNEEIISANQKLLDAIATADYDTYRELCAEDLTAFEPESLGNLVQGLGFHKYYFDLFGKPSKPINVTMSNPHVRWIGDGSAAVISYVRLDQLTSGGEGGGPLTRTKSETRVWENINGKWINVHFHKS